jgi:hypothetical protein
MLRFDRANSLGAIGAMFFIFVTVVSGQDAQYEAVLNDSAQRDLRPSIAHSYEIKLNRGDYAAGSVAQRGALINATLFLPNGERERDFSAAIAERIQFAFTAAT